MKANQEIRDMLTRGGIKQWELAQKMGYTPNYFVLKMRTELPEAEKRRAMKSILEIIEGRG